MISKETKAILVGILALLIFAFLLNLGLKLSFGLSAFVGVVIGVSIGLIVYVLTK